MICKINNIDIYYEERGTGIPILCIHGYFMDHKLLAGCMEPIFQVKKVDGFKRVYIDLPGMGRSSSSSSIKNADDMLEILVKFIDVVIKDKDFLVMSNSYGGYLTQGLTYLLGDRVKGMFLLCPVAVPDYNNRRLPLVTKSKQKEAIEIGGQKEAYDDFAKMAMVINNDTWKRYKEEILPGMRLADSTFLNKYQREGYSLSFDEKLSDMKYSKPVTILLGRQDNIVGYIDMVNNSENYDSATIFMVDNAGHNLQLDQPEVFEYYLLKFLAHF